MPGCREHSGVTDLLPGDQIQARLHAVQDGADQWLVTEFIVASVRQGGAVLGSAFYPQGLDPVQGWTFELIARSVSLPVVLSEIVAQVGSEQNVPLVGKGGMWMRADNGQRVNPDDVQSFVPIEDVGGEILVAEPPVSATFPGQ